MTYNISANIKRDAMKTTVTFSINLPYRTRQEGRGFVAWCPLVDVSSFGETRERAVAMLAEAVNLFISECFRMGTLDQVLRECGFAKAVKAESRPRQTVAINLPADISLRLAECLA